MYHKPFLVFVYLVVSAELFFYYVQHACCSSSNCSKRVTLNDASDYRTNGLYRTSNPSSL